jgi:RNA-directed DNA polymerase
VRQRVVGHLHERLTAHERLICRQDGTLDLATGRVDALQATLASYLGHFHHAQSARLIRDTFAQHPWLQHLLRCLNTDPVRLQRLDRPPQVTSFASQWRYFSRRYPDHVVLLQVGNRLETYGAQCARLPRGLTKQAVVRPKLGAGYAWPIARGAALRKILRRHQIPFCQVVEDGYLRGGMKRRVLRWVY